MKASAEQALLALTRDMLALAQNSDWEKLAALEQARLPIYQQVFERGIAGCEALAREILSLDEQTLALARAGMPLIEEALLKLKNSGKANKAYRSIQNSTLNDG